MVDLEGVEEDVERRGQKDFQQKDLPQHANIIRSHEQEPTIRPERTRHRTSVCSRFFGDHELSF